MLDRAAPQKNVRYTYRPHKSWFNNYIWKQRKLVKKQGSNLQKSQKKHHWRAYTIERNMYNRLLKYHKRQVITKQIIDNSKNTKELFKIVNKLMGFNTDNPLLPDRTSEETAENFAEFFLDKINKIWQLFMGIPPYQPRKTDMPGFESFTPLTQEARREIMGTKTKAVN